MRTATLAVSGASPELKIRYRIRKFAVWLGVLSGVLLIGMASLWVYENMAQR